MAILALFFLSWHLRIIFKVMAILAICFVYVIYCSMVFNLNDHIKKFY